MPVRTHPLSTIDVKEYRSTFDIDVDAYDRARPGYPHQLLELCAPGTAALSMVEVGCGSGQATQLFLPRASSITAIDLSSKMLEAARRTCPSERVTYVVGPFETVSLPIGKCDLVYSAQSFHWLDVAKGFERAKRLLRPGGTLAIFWNFIRFDSPGLREMRDTILARAPVFEFFPDSSDAKFDGFREEWAALAFRHMGNARVDILSHDMDRGQRWIMDWLATLSWWKKLDGASRGALSHELDAMAGVPTSIPVRTLVVRSENAP